jgi:hypothetical protein
MTGGRKADSAKKEKKMKVNWKKELWAAMCQYDGEFTLAHAENVFKYFDCDECPGKIGNECDACPIKKAENATVSNLWEISANSAKKGINSERKIPSGNALRCTP